MSITEDADITQASAWVDPATPFTLDSETHDILLTEADNQLGNLILTGQNASVTESDPAGITEAGAWSIPGATTLTAGSDNPIVLTAEPSNNLGTVSIVSASTADIWTAGGVVIGDSTVSTGDLKIDAGGPITQSGAITAPELLLVGTGDATLTNPGNDVGTLAAGFSGGDLAFTDSGDLAIGVIGGTTGVTIGDHNVTLTSINGTVTGLTDVNASSSSLTVDAGTDLSLPQLAIAGPQTYTAPSGITLTAGLTSTASGAITFESPVTLAADLTVQSTHSPITFQSTVDGAGYQLGVNAGSGLVNFDDAVSGLGATTDASAALTLASGGANFAGTVSANNGLAVTGPVTFNDAVTLADGSAASVFTGLVTLGKPGGMSLSGYNGMSFDGGVLLQNGPATIDSNDSPLVFQTAGSVSGPYGLTLDSGTASITGLGRMGSDLTSLTVTALSPTIPAGGISIAGPQTYTASPGSNITLDGNVTSTAGGAITFNGPVILGAAVTVGSDNSPVDFGGTVDGNQNLTVSAGTGTTEFSGAVGAVTPVGSGTGASIALESAGTTTFASIVQTRSGITAAGPVVFDGDVTLGNGDTASVFSGSVTAGGSSGSTLTGYKGLAFNGGLTLSGGPVTIDSNGGTIALGGPVTGAESLTLDALAGGAGTVTGLDQIGPSSDLTALDVTGQTLSLPSTGLAAAGPMTFTAAGGITLNGAVGSAASPASGAVTFNGPVSLATGPVTVTTANAPILFNGTVDGAQPLAVDAGSGTTTFADDVGDSTAVTGLETGSGGTTLLDAANIHTSGTQAYGGPVTLGADVALNGDNVQFAGTVDGAHALTITDSGTTTLGGTVGGSRPLTRLDVGAAGAIAANSGSVTTTGAQTYDGAVTLGSDASFSGDGIDFGSTVDGAHALTANAGPGVLSFTGAVGGSTPLASLSATGEQLGAGNVSTTGSQAYTAVAGVSLGGALDTSGGDVTVTGPTTLTGDTSVTTEGGDINFSGSASTINGDHALTLTGGSGNVLLGGVVGGAAPLSAFTDSGFDLTLPDVATVGDANQSYSALDNITLTQSRTVNAPVSFTADADGNGAGSFILQNGVSLTASNHPLAITAADLDLEGSSTLSSGTGVTTITATDGRNIYLGGSTTAPGQLTITGDELSRMSSSGGLVLNTTGSGWIDVDGITAQQSQNITGTLDLEAQGSGAISFISGPSTFSALKANAAGGATNIGVNVTTVGHTAEFVTPVTVSGASTIASGGGNIKFDSGVSVANDLTLDSDNGTLTFSGPVGSTSTLTLNLGGGSVAGLSQLQSSLTGLTISGSAAITLPAIDINGPQVYDTGAITVTGDLTGTGIEFNSVLTAAPSSGSSLTLNARTGTLAFNGITNFQATDMTLTADDIGFSQPVAGSGNLLIQPYTASDNIGVGASGSSPGALTLTSVDLAELPLADLASLTLGGASDTGAIDVAAALEVSDTPLILNGGGGITQSGGAITSGALTLNAAGNAIDLPNAANAFGAVAILGTPTAVTLANSKEISQQGFAGWTLGGAPVTLNAGTADIDLGNSGNTFGTLVLTGGNATVSEAADTDLGASSLSGDLAVISSGGIDFSGALAAHGDVSLNAAGQITQSAPLSIGGNLDALTTLNAGDVTIDNSGAASTTVGNSEVGGNYALTATGEPVTQAAGSAIQVVGNLTVTAATVDLSGAANLIGGTTSLPASDTTVIERPGVIDLSSGTYSGNLTVISQRTSRSFGSSEVSGSAIVLDDSSNDIGGTISVSASPPTIVTGSDVQTGITQQGGSSLSVAGVGTFTAEDSSAGSLGIDLSNAGNVFGALQVTGTTVTLNNAATAATTLESSEATTSLAITAAGGVMQAGAIDTPALTVNAAGAIALDSPNNQIGTLSASSSGNAIEVVDAETLSVAGIDAGGATLSLTVAGSGNLTQTGAITNVASLTADAGGSVTLNNSGNTIQSLAASSAGTGLQLYDSSALSVSGAVGSATGDMVVRAVGDVTLQSGGSLAASAGNLVVSTEGSGNFINDSALAGAALDVGSGERWLVYSDTPDLVSGAHTVKGGLTSDFRAYGATYTTYTPDSVTQSGDGFIYDYTKPTLVIDAAISGSATQVYGDDPTGTLGYTIVSGLVDSEDGAGNVITGGAATYSMALSNSLDAGTYTIQYTGGLTSNYTLQTDPTGVTYTVTPAVLSYVASAASRTYGAENPALTGTVTGFKLGQTAATVLTGTLAWSTVATTASPVGSYAIEGSGYTTNGNYTLAQAGGNATALSITKAPLTVTGSNDTVTYNGTGYSGGAGVTYNGFVNGEGASVLGGTLAYGGDSQGARNAGVYAITPSGFTSGNYAITYDSGSLTINKASLEVTTSDVTKTYDGTLATTGTAIATGGTRLYGTDSLSGGTYEFTNANAGSGDKTVTVSGVTVSDGNGGDNYQITYVANGQSTIDPESITVSTANVSKTYDGTDSAAGTPTVISGALYHNASNSGAQDTLSGGTFAFTDPNAGSGDKTVAVSAVAVSDGNGGGNYDVTYADNATSTINPAPLIFSGAVAEKTYDGTTTAGLSGYSLSGLIGDQTLGVTVGAANFSDPNAGTGKSVSISGIALSDGTEGGLASNYAMSPMSTASGTIDPKTLTVNVTVSNKVYDGTTAAVVENYGLSGFVGNQTVTPVYTGSSSFDNKNVGDGKQVSITGIELVNGANGGLATNYAVPTTVTGSADITPATLHIAGAVADDKVYDGTTTAYLDTRSAVLTGVVGSDSVSVSTLTGTFAMKDVGTSIPIGTGTVVLSGADAGNYTLVQPSGLTADITPRPLTVTGTGVNKAYDGTTAAAVELSDNALPGDSVAVTSTNAFLDPSAGAGKYISVSDISVSGADAQDYVANTSTSTYATVMPATLFVTATGEDRPYDGTTTAQVTLSGDALAGDQVTLGDASATFSSPDSGNGKTITVDGIYISGGAAARDYVVGETTATTTADITGTGSATPPPPPATSSADTGQWSLPPAIPAPQPPVMPTAAASVLDVSLPANFGTGGGGASTVTGNGAGAAASTEATNAGASNSGTSGGGAGGGSAEGAAEPNASATGSAAGMTSGASGGGQAAVASGRNAPSGAVASGGEASARGGASTVGPEVVVSLMVPAKAPLKGLVLASVPEKLLDQRSQIRIPLPEQVVEAIGAGSVSVTGVKGGSLPKWLSYEPMTHTLIGSAVPAAALPYKALVRSGEQSWVVLITGRFGS
ncbi:MAG TPA: YDG domain-containing protein [Steroidobacteraceae bacterium]|nr:YDG domain-containing protein [Steroidobacteraceae bacterium]